MKLLFKISRIVSSIFSVLGGVFCVFFFLNSIIQNYIISLPIAIVLMIFYELTAVIILHNSFKQIFETNKQYFLFIPVALAFYVGSFFLTVNGVEKFVDFKVNKTEEISQEKSFNQDSILQIYDKKIEKNNKILDTLRKKPKNWKNHKIILKDAEFLRLQNIEYQKTKDSLIVKNNRVGNNQIAVNSKILKTAKRDYYFISSLIMISIFIFNFICNFLDYKELQACKKPIKDKQELQITKLTEKIFELEERLEMPITYKDCSRIEKTEYDKTLPMKLIIRNLFQKGFQSYEIKTFFNIQDYDLTRIKKKI